MKHKYNKNLGFTMIEMLATILVLLVILLIATPSIRRMLNKTNELSKEYVENIIIDSAREYAIVNNKTITSKLKLVGDTSVISLTTLLNVGLIEQSDIDTLGPNARVLLTLKENNYVEYKIVYDGTLVENNASHIVLLGGNPLYVKQGTPYLEPGYISYDRDGKIITDKVLVTGTVNTDIIGNYVLTYKITDDLGNTEEVKRTVIVVDNTYPKVTVATTVSNNPYNNKFAKNGERITLNITFSKVVTDPKVTIGGREATLSGSGTTRTATLLIPSDESSLVSNKGLEIKISDYIDEYDNIGQIQTDVTSGGLVVFDNIAPTCSVAKSNTGTTAGVTATVTATNSPVSGISSGTGTFTGLKANATYTITSGAGLTGTCSITVTPQTQHRAQSCSAYSSCANAACGYNSCANSACGAASCRNSSCSCATWGNYTSTLRISNCTESGNPGTNQVYVRNTRWGQWTCNCRSNPQPACTWQVVARSCWYNPGSCEDSCGTACSRNNNPGWAGCGNWYGNDEWANSGTVCEQRVYTGSCATYNSCANASACGYKSCAVAACGNATCATSACGCSTWGAWGAWSTTACSAQANVRQCQTQTVYN